MRLLVNVILVSGTLQHSATTHKDHRMRLLVNVILVREAAAFCDNAQGSPDETTGQCDADPETPAFLATTHKDHRMGLLVNVQAVLHPIVLCRWN